MPLPRSLSRYGIALLLPLLLSGCAAVKLYHEGQDLEESGKEYPAANKYLDALHQNEKLKKPREALTAIAEAAYDEKLKLAQDYEGTERYPDALKEYRALVKYLDRLKDENALTFAVIDANAKVGDMQNAAAEQQYKLAETALQAHQWDAAITSYTSAQGFKAGYKDTADKVALAQYSWGDDELTARRHRSAAEHYVKATESAGSGYKDAGQKAGGIYAALGHYFIGADRCRQAVKDLRVAAQLMGPSAVATDAAAADGCAITTVAILPFENPTGQTVAGMALGDALADQTAAKVSRGASEFVHLMERGALDALLAEQGMSAQAVAGGSTSRLTGVRYLVLGKLTQVRMQRAQPTVSTLTSTAVIPYDCPKTNSKGETYQGTCNQDVTVAYRRHDAQESLTIAGSLRVVDVKTGAQLAAPSLSASLADRISYAEGFAVNGSSVTVVRRGFNGGTQVPDDVLELSEARSMLVDEGQLVQQALDKMSGDAAQAVLRSVDIEQQATDPSTLTLAGVK